MLPVISVDAPEIDLVLGTVHVEDEVRDAVSDQYAATSFKAASGVEYPTVLMSLPMMDPGIALRDPEIGRRRVSDRILDDQRTRPAGEIVDHQRFRRDAGFDRDAPGGVIASTTSSMVVAWVRST